MRAGEQIAMKTLCIALLGLLAVSSPSRAASVTVPDASPTLPNLATTTTALLVNAGLPLKNIGDGNVSVEVKDFHCDHYSRMALDASDPHAGLPTDTCRINAKNLRGTKTGKAFVEA